MYIIAKRWVDVFLAFWACILLAPAAAVLAALIWLDSPGPVIFRQRRVGAHRRHFDILKFRTMQLDTPKDVPTHLLGDPTVYVTRMGRFLRRTSLDELPQLINILKGDMSIVGPRPALWNQQDLLAIRQRLGVNDIRPGLTGLAQIKGRDELPIRTKARYDAIYLRHMGLVLDIAIVVKTAGRVFTGEGIRQ